MCIFIILQDSGSRQFWDNWLHGDDVGSGSCWGRQVSTECQYTAVIISLCRFQDEVSWAFKMFDIDNSGSIVVEEIKESVQVSSLC